MDNTYGIDISEIAEGELLSILGAKKILWGPWIKKIMFLKVRCFCKESRQREKIGLHYCLRYRQFFKRPNCEFQEAKFEDIKDILRDIYLKRRKNIVGF